MLIADYEKAEKLYEEIIAAHPKHLPAHLLLIQNIETNELKTQYPLTFVKTLKTSNNGNNNNNKVVAVVEATASEATTAGGGSSSGCDGKQKDDNEKIRNATAKIVRLADQVINAIDKDALLAYYGLKNDTRPDAAKIKS